MVATSHIIATYRSFSCICKVMPMFEFIDYYHQSIMAVFVAYHRHLRLDSTSSFLVTSLQQMLRGSCQQVTRKLATCRTFCQHINDDVSDFHSFI